MPTISSFFGIKIMMFDESQSKHHVPHIHAIFGEYEAVLTFDGGVLEGDLPSSKMKLIQAWIEIHKAELNHNWNLLKCGIKCVKIEPLR